MSTTAATSTIAQNLSRVLSKIQSCASSPSNNVTLIAVSKTKPSNALLECYESGQRHFGENYVQELIEKSKELPSDIHWHFIGHLQSNKVKSICQIPNLYMVHTVDRQKIAKALNSAMSEVQKQQKLQAENNNRSKLKVLVQVNTSGEDSKSGCEPSDTIQLCKYVIDQCPFLELCGLMTIGDLTNSKSTLDYNPDFEKLVSLRGEVCQELGIDQSQFHLSMGMSSDYELAIKYGATFVRVGSTIFGERDYSQTK